ncbi:MAG: glycerol-3-phosphate dehydrogenase/oxidase [Actinomycetota bacterium]|nr:glycerol-3-phosphate dehydrogenase/oxidase [Actinomycetota bacterium]
MSSRLDAVRRERELDALSRERVDVLVVGGGVTGCGIALDAASRGLSVALVEKDDLAFGTSRWSSKLVHGGLRYLATGDVGIAWESALERRTLMTTTAPHLVRPLPMVVPLGTDVSPRQGMLVDAGHRSADVLRRSSRTSARVLPPPRRLGRVETQRLVPGVRREGLRGGLLNWDGQLEDDARLVVALARSAAALGASILTRVRYDGEGRLVDALTGASLQPRATTVVNATGAWADTISPGVRLQPSKGVHLVLDAAQLGRPTASMTVPVPSQPNRYVFALPHPDGLVYVGLTDDPLDGPLPEVAVAEEHEISFLLDTLNRGLERPLSRADVLGTFAGVRPLVAGEQGITADLSRRHLVTLDDGLLTVLGGKLTTYRKMAQDAVDRLTDVPCRTTTLPLVGAGAVNRAELAAAGPAAARLVRRYGSEAPDVAALAATDPALLEPVIDGAPVLGVELVWGLVAEGALCAEDLLERRTRLSLVDAWAAAARPVVERRVAEVHAGGRA